MSEGSERYVVRPPFWLTGIRTAIHIQGALIAVLFVMFTFRVAIFLLMGAKLSFLISPDDSQSVGLAFGLATFITIVLTLRRWWGGGALLSAEGLHWPERRGRWPLYIFWNRVTVVQRRHGWRSGRWLRVVSEYGEAINLPERPADFDGFRDAVERFAGEAHPLSRALAEVAEEG